MFKKLYTIVVKVLLLYSYTFCAPYHGEIVEFEQPDGSKVKVVLYGDEYCMRAESLDGYTLIRDTHTGWICYADISEDAKELVSTGIVYRDNVSFEELRDNLLKVEKDQKKINRIKRLRPKLNLKDEEIKKLRNNNKKRLTFLEEDIKYPYSSDDTFQQENIIYPAPPTRKATGTIKGLVIIVDFPDAPATLPLEEYERWFNDMNYSNFNNNGSVRKYFYDISEGKLDYQGVVFGIFRATNTFAYYDSLPYGEGARRILQWALTLIDQQGFDFSTLSTTTGTPRYILAINLVHTGNPSTWAQGMWWHSGQYTGFTADGVRSRWYATMPANSPLRIGTACHENGHMVCGWPDTYKYDSSTGPDGIGAFDLMCNSGSGTNPVPPNPYFLFTVGWASLVDTNDWGARIIFDTANDLVFYRYRNLNNLKEFYILNTVRKTGRYTNVPDEGLCIWRIDEDGDNQTTRHLVYLVHANNNITDHSRACFRADRGYDKFNAYTTPAATWYGDILSFFNVCNISNVSSTMTYRIYDLDKEWYFLSNHEGWRETSNAIVSVSTPGILVLSITGSNAFVMSPDNLMLPATTYQYIRIRLKNTTNSNQARFFWITATDTQWNDTKSVSFSISGNDTDFKEYIINLSTNSAWTGRIRRLRFTPVVSSGRIEIDYIRLDREIDIIPGKIYAIKSVSSNKFISVRNNSSASAEEIVQLDYQGLLGQNWKVEDVGDSYYRITSLVSNLVLDVRNANIANGADLIQWNWLGTDNQKFKIDSLGTASYRLSARHSGKVLQVEGNSSDSGVKIVQWDWVSGSSQRWNFILTHSVDVTISPPQTGSVTRSINYERYLRGTQITLTAIPSKGYRFAGWTGSYSSPSPVLQLNITNDLQLTANFTLTTHTVLVAVSPSNSATVEVQPKQDYYTYGTTVTLFVIPNEGYEFVGWSGDLNVSSNPLKLIIENDINLTANLRLTTHTLTVNVEPPQAAQVEIYPLRDYYTYFDTVTIRLTISEGYEFLGWSGSYSGFENPLFLEVKGDISLSANFKLTTHTVLVNIIPEHAGGIVRQPDLEFYEYNSSLTITAVAFEGWQFDRWEVDSEIIKENPLNLVIKKNLSISSIFAPSLHTVNLKVAPQQSAGYIVKIPSQTYYEYGSTLTVRAFPNEGWEFVGWYDKENLVFDNSYFEITVRRDLELTALFKLTTHTISIILNPQNAGEYIVVPYQQYYTYGSTAIIKANPFVGWEFVNWTGDINAKEREVLLEIKKDLVIFANFRLSTYTITVEVLPVDAAEIKLIPLLNYYTYGTTVTVQAIPKKRYRFIGWEGDVLAKDEQVITLIMDSQKYLVAKCIQISDFLLSLNGDNINNEIYLGEEVKKVEIYSHKGNLIKNVFSNKLSEEILEKLPIGFYILKINLNDETYRWEKLIIIR